MTVTTIKTPLELVVGYLEDTLTPSKDFQLERILYKDIDTRWEFPYHPKFGWIVLWDSGLVGYIFTTRERIRELMGWKRLTSKRLEEIYKILREEIEVLDAYLNGSVYCYNVYNENGELWSESCGYIDVKDALKDAKFEIDLLTKKEV